MQSDDVVWQVINNQFCSFKVKTATTMFCRNENNVTGLCNRSSCPLANSQYATVREIDGKLVLLKKTVERAHTPAKLWERISLSTTKEEGLAKIKSELRYWSPFLLDKCRQRYERVLEIKRRMQKLVAKAKDQPILTTKASKVERREKGRERKAKAAARLEMSIEKELVERLQKGVYGDMYNVHQKAFESVLNAEGQSLELVEDEDEEGLEEEYEFVEADEEDEDDFIIESDVEYQLEEEEEEESRLGFAQDIEDLAPSASRAHKKAKPYVEIEYETEPAEAIAQK